MYLLIYLFDWHYFSTKLLDFMEIFQIYPHFMENTSSSQNMC